MKVGHSFGVLDRRSSEVPSSLNYSLRWHLDSCLCSLYAWYSPLTLFCLSSHFAKWKLVLFSRLSSKGIFKSLVVWIKDLNPCFTILFRDEMMKAAWSIQVGYWFPECSTQTLSGGLDVVNMDHTAWLWFSKISTFLKKCWFHPVYVGNRDEETSEDLRTKHVELSGNPNTALERSIYGLICWCQHEAA